MGKRSRTNRYWALQLGSGQRALQGVEVSVFQGDFFSITRSAGQNGNVLPGYFREHEANKTASPKPALLVQ